MFGRLGDSIISHLNSKTDIQFMEQDVNKNDKALQTEGQDPAVQQCVICLDPISGKAVAKPCGHPFDFKCLTTWLQERQTCPLCKLEVHSVDYNCRSTQDFQIYQVAQIASLPDSRHLSNGDSPSDSLTRAINTQILEGFTSALEELRPRVDGLRSLRAALRRRRQVYLLKLYSLHVGSNRISGYRELTPQRFAHDETLVSRARKWIKRELQIFEFLYGDRDDESQTWRLNNAEILLEYIISMLKVVDIQDSEGRFEDMVEEFIGEENAPLFLHELKSWLRSPYESLEEWDLHVQYNDRTPSVTRQTQGTSSTVSHRRHFQPDQRRPISSHTPTVERSLGRADCYRPSRHRSSSPMVERPLRRADCYRPSRRSAHHSSRNRTIQPNLIYDHREGSSQH